MANDFSSLGQHFIVGLSGPALLAEERELLARLKPLGIVLFAKNIQSAEIDWRTGLNRLIAEAQEASKRETFLVSIDHEGGRVHRFPPPVTKFPAARAWAELSGEVSAAMARELRALGFSLSFAPVLDIHSQPLNKVIGDRAFGDEPMAVSKSAERAMHALHQEGILSCGKHFPGHGDTVQDSHFELPTLSLSRAELETRELIPFRHLISIGIPMIMSAHVVYPAIDPNTPASLSQLHINKLLRQELGFTGVVITDDLEMKALHSYSVGDRALAAMLAGSDILLEANRKDGLALEHAMTMAEALFAAERKGSLDLSASRTRINRMLSFVSELSRIPRPPAEVLGCEDHLALLSRTSRSSLLS